MKKVVDHLGNEYQSTVEMCKAYGISVYTYRSRIRRGVPLRQALTCKVQSNGQEGVSKDGLTAIDHLGNVYLSLNEMCKYYGISYPTYKDRIKRGWSVEEALTMKALPFGRRKYEIMSKDKHVESSEEEPKNNKTEKGVNDRVVYKYDSSEIIDPDKIFNKCMYLIGLLKIKGVTLSACKVEKMFNDHECEEYKYLQVLLS